MENPFTGDNWTIISRRLPNVDEATVRDYIADAWAKAVDLAPCIAKSEFDEAKIPLVISILRGIILRWHEAQAGGLTAKTQMAGPYQQSLQLDARPKRGYVLQPSEIIDLQRLCTRKGRPFSVDTIPDEFSVTAPLHGVVVNGNTETLNGPPGEWSPDAPELDL
jgi:hypothetical protein